MQLYISVYITECPVYYLVEWEQEQTRIVVHSKAVLCNTGHERKFIGEERFSGPNALHPVYKLQSVQN